MEILSNVIIWAGLIFIIYWGVKKHKAKKVKQKYNKYTLIIIGLICIVLGTLIYPDTNFSTNNDVKQSSNPSIKSDLTSSNEQSVKRQKQTQSTSFSTSKTDSNNSKETSQKTEKNKNQQQNDLKYQAQYFGQKDVETLQKMSSTYKSMRVDDGMMYTFHFNNDMLVRVDTDDGYTTVYKYDENANDGLGEQLYNGKTIMQKEKRSYYYIN